MKKAILLFILISATILFLMYGRSLYMPIIKKVKGKETVDSVANKLEKDVFERLRRDFAIVGLADFPKEIILVGLKEEKLLEIYVKSSTGIKFLKQYPFTASSGVLGPKLKEGDRQIPEGIYKVEYLNPNSAYYLSMKINYPNDFDVSKTKFANLEDLGSNIFIHGKASTIGCIPIGDEAIEEVFLLAKNALNNEIKVIICPRDFRKSSKYPNISSIDWENELYDEIKKELSLLAKKS